LEVAPPSRPKFSRAAAPIERPIPLRILYPLFFVGVYLTHFSLLHLPYFWDEAGYYIPAALDFFRTGSLIPHSTLTNAHPPLPSILLATWWRLCGLSIGGTRVFMCIISAAALLGVFRLGRVLAGPFLATIVTLLTALYPVWFAQSTLTHADLFAAAFTLWALSFYFERFGAAPADHLSRVALLFSLAALSKETAIVTPVALGLWELVQLLTERRDDSSTANPRWVAALFLPVAPLMLWYLYHFRQTGFIFGNPEFLRYNATANFTLTRVLVSLWHRFVHLTLHMNMYVPVLATLAALLMPRVAAPTRATTRPVLTVIGIILTGNAIAFSILGGALLTRYLLPMYPLILLVCVALWYTRGRVLYLLTGLTAAAFAVGLFINPPYAIAPEDNLTYADMVRLHQQAIAILDKQFPYATVLSAWPATTEMQHPELGYTTIPLKTVPIDNFSAAELQKAAADPGAYDTALIFSTKWVPRLGWLNLGRASESADARYFDFHRDLSPQEAAAMLHGQVVWQGYRNGEWAAILRFPRAVEARLRF
jgi:4-amino-4-deoxy-L-arabinose transferase-like glycosyltransferase